MKKLNDPENILSSSILICPERHYLMKSSNYIGKRFIQSESAQKIEDIFYCTKCNQLYSIKELKKG